MWPFDRKRTKDGQWRAAAVAPAGKAESGSATTDGLAATNAVAIEKLSKRLDAIEMEWLEWFDKFRRLYARLAKRQERQEREEAAENPESARQDHPLGRTNGIAEVSQHGGPRAPRRNY